MATKTTSTNSKTETKTSQATTDTRKPSKQALQAVDVAIGAGPTVAENVKTTAETWTNSETRSQEIDALQKRVQTLRDSQGRKSEIETLRKRLATELEKAESKGGDVRRQVTDQLIGRARKARDRVEPVYRERFEPVVKQRVEPVYKERVEPIYKQRIEPTVKKVVERV
jgi:molecular chaperone GrpE (heat shock protein)